MRGGGKGERVVLMVVDAWTMCGSGGEIDTETRGDLSSRKQEAGKYIIIAYSTCTSVFDVDVC